MKREKKKVWKHHWSEDYVICHRVWNTFEYRKSSLRTLCWWHWQVCGHGLFKHFPRQLYPLFNILQFFPQEWRSTFLQKIPFTVANHSYCPDQHQISKRGIVSWNILHATHALSPVAFLLSIAFDLGVDVGLDVCKGVTA